jgi:hypothetical protein
LAAPFWSYYLTPEGMREALAGLNFNLSLSVLVERGFVTPDSSGRSSRAVSPPGHPKTRLYAVEASILHADR